MKTKLLIWTLCVFILSSFVCGTQLRCEYDETPYIVSEFKGFENKITWFCNSTMYDYYCITTIEKQGEYLQVNPTPKGLVGEGMLDKFESDGKSILVYFIPEANIILGGEIYNFSVICGNGTTILSVTANITPTYRDDMVWVINRGDWFIQNKGYIIVWTLVIIFILALAGLVWNYIKKG